MKYKINDRIGQLVIIEDTKKRISDGQVVWKCLCDCGNIIEISTSGLRAKIKKGKCNCGCELKKEQQLRMAKIIPIGTKYPHFTIIDGPFFKQRHNSFYKVKFDETGEEVELSRKSIMRNPNQYKPNHRTPEGELNIFLNQNKIIEPNTQIGLLTIIGQPFIKNNRLQYHCQCDCGNTIDVRSTYLTRSNPRLSCGCLYSKGEQQIQQLLMGWEIDFEREYKFSDLIDVNPLRFDFAVFNDNELVGLIEFNGRQHYIVNNNSGWNDEESFSLTQKHDKMKKEYCQQNNIPLLIIPYSVLDKQNLLETILNDFLIQLF